MPHIIIDGKSFEYEGRPRLLQFAMDNGVEIPYFCYHPAMSTPTNCRMCLVEVGFPAFDPVTKQPILDEKGEPKINWGRKPATACNQDLSNGMVVRTHKTSEVVEKAQKGVLEYMLTNHPLDCPICDQAGECPLQIWTYKYGPEGSRFQEMKVHKPKRIELGPNVVLDAERCINCTRCVRFTEEISKTNQLTIVNRGEKNYPSCAPGESFTDAYSMNTIDLCPVGALTSRDFRFDARVWEMAYTPGIDMNDSTGTNIDVWVRDNKVMRITPRFNAEVNQYWMPDAYRLNIAQYNENRISGIHLKGRTPVAFEEGLKHAAAFLKGKHEEKTWFFGSPYASLESNLALRDLAAKSGEHKVYYVPHIVSGSGDNWLMQEDKTPNAAACEKLGFIAMPAEELRHHLEHHKIKAMVSLENDVVFGELGALFAGVRLMTFGTQWQSGHDHAEIVLPAATSIEAEGTYINYKGKAQVSHMAKQIAQMTPEMWMRIPKSRLDKAAVAVDRWRDLKNVFDVLPSWLLIAKINELNGHTTNWKEHKDIFSKCRNEFPELLHDVKPSTKVPREAFKITQFDFAIR